MFELKSVSIWPNRNLCSIYGTICAVVSGSFAVMSSSPCWGMRCSIAFGSTTISKGCPMPVQTHTRTTHSYMHPTRGRSVDTHGHGELPLKGLEVHGQHTVPTRRTGTVTAPVSSRHRSVGLRYKPRRSASTCSRSSYGERRRIAAYSLVLGVLMGASLFYAWEEPRDTDAGQRSTYGQSSVTVVPSEEG